MANAVEALYKYNTLSWKVKSFQKYGGSTSKATFNDLQALKNQNKQT